MNTSPISSARPIAGARDKVVSDTPAQPSSAPVAAPVASASARVAEAGAPPVDTDRVAMIRKAIAEGNYPIVPAKIADAIIAAGILLRTPK